MTSRPMDYPDYLIRQHEQERIRQQFEGLFSKSDEEHAADQADRVAQLAYDTAEARAVGASEVEEALTEVVTVARDLRKRISGGLVSEKDARKALGSLRKRRANLVARTASIKTAAHGKRCGKVRTPDPEAPPVGHLSRGLSSVMCDRWGQGPTIIRIKLPKR